MYTDAFLLVSDAQAFTATAVSTHTIDLSTVTRNIAIGEPLGFGVVVDVAADMASGDDAYVLEAVESDTDDLSSPTVTWSVPVLASQLTVGSHHFVPLGAVTKRYIGFRLTASGSTPTVTLSVSLTPRDMFSKAPPHHENNYAV